MYERWATLTEAEGQAIRSAAWPQVSRLQDEKHSLQGQIVNASERLQAEMDCTSAQWKTVEQTIRSVIERLIVMETRNGEILVAKRLEAEEERRDLDRTDQNLRKVHRAYGSSRNATWNSYS